ncbi:MAG: ABC transporter substrate-binding protein [Halobacteriaceae archaeon]
MSDPDDSRLARSIDRRRFVAGMGAGLATGLAGCSTGGGGDGGTTTPTPTPTQQMPESPPEGGTATFGMVTAPKTMNPLVYDDAYEYEIIRRLYDFGVTVDPRDYSYKPWTFTDWTVNAENAGTSSPTITATMRDDTEFSDGEPVTPEDYKFTIEYLKEQGVTGSISASQVSYVEDVVVDGNEVDLFLSKAYNGWFGDILAQIILPKHIWKNVSDYTTYEPRKTDEGVVGSGPMVLDDYSWQNWFDFSYRDDSVIPWPQDDNIDWIHPEGPFLKGHRLEIFGNNSTLQQEVMAGNVTCMFQGVQPSAAATAQNKEGIEVAQNPSLGYDHIDMNLRRVPFDDRVFRQFMRKMVDSEWIVANPYDDIGAQRGSYASIASFEDWRPPEPWEADEYEGIPLPTLEFPGEAGTFSLTESQVQAAREFLTTHPDAKYNYTFEEGSQGKTNSPDDKQLFVDGERLTEAHTNNDGEGGQGPLNFIYQPPGEDKTQNQTGEKVVSALRKVGVPTSKTIESISSAQIAIFFEENFDMFSMGWGITPYLTLYRSLYGEAGVDTEGTTDRVFYNPMGYTGAQDLIDQDVSTMERSKRIPIVKKIQAQIWYDAPTIITIYKKLLEPHPAEYEGFYTTAGGLFENPWMNVYVEDGG